MEFEAASTADAIAATLVVETSLSSWVNYRDIRCDWQPRIGREQSFTKGDRATFTKRFEHVEQSRQLAMLIS